MKHKRPDNAALAAGISPDYLNAHGEKQAISAETMQRLLDAMHAPGSAHKAALTPVPGVQVFICGHRIELDLKGHGDFGWQLMTEAGQQHKGVCAAGEKLHLPAKLAEGYHELTLTQDKRRWRCRVIIAPPRCFEPEALRQDKKLWGACVQLYTLRSSYNWGIGDFGDLKRMLVNVAKRGGSFIGLNPLHALYPANPESASPYSPSSRRWLNVIYIDVNAVEDFRGSEEAQAWWQMPATQQMLKAVRDAKWVDYSGVTVLKMAALHMAWKQFLTREAGDKEVQVFQSFVEQGGESLFHHAAYDALHAYEIQEDEMRWGWPVWPEKYRDAHGPEVKQFCEEHRDEVNFFLWLQYLASGQFEACWLTGRSLAMPIGLYRDLAVGVAEGGSETWCDRQLYCLKASVGAPPDTLGPLGQNWGLPPMDPHVIVERAYEPFIELLRANMTHCGALRIDHVMSMLRLWWIPYGETADKGAYVHYPVDAMLSILALESQRHRCMVIGEDLGTVPVEIIGKLRDSGVYSYKVLWFEQDNEKRFRAPLTWPKQSMAVATTHDLPTLRGYWDSGDLMLGKTLGLYPDEEMLCELYQDRERAKQGLLDSLHKYGYLPKRAGHKASRMAMSTVLNRAMQRYIAGSSSSLLGLQPEDWLDMAEPVNIPGTSYQYKNWRRKLTTSLEKLFADERINKLLKDLDKRRRNSG